MQSTETSRRCRRQPRFSISSCGSLFRVANLPSIEEDDENYDRDDSDSDHEDGDAYGAFNVVYERRTVDAACDDDAWPPSHASNIACHDSLVELRREEFIQGCKDRRSRWSHSIYRRNNKTRAVALEDDSCLDAYLCIMNPFLEKKEGPELPGMLGLEERNSSGNSSSMRAHEQ